jgi:hypothetical protein
MGRGFSHSPGPPPTYFLVAVVVANEGLFSGPVILFPSAGYFGKRWNSHHCQHRRHSRRYRQNQNDAPHTKPPLRLCAPSSNRALIRHTLRIYRAF